MSGDTRPAQERRAIDTTDTRVPLPPPVSPLLRGMKRRSRAGLPGNAWNWRIYAPEMSLSESMITCHTPSVPLPFVLNGAAPTEVYKG
jgi:hypothetical protein